MADEEKDENTNPNENSAGYGRPPRHRQFKKGQSGNPRGRPRKRERAWTEGQRYSDVLTEAYREIEVKANGKVERLPIIQLIVRQLFTRAAQGNVRAMDLSIELVSESADGRARLLPRLYDDAVIAEQNTFCQSLQPPSDNLISFLDYLKKRTRQT